MFFGNLNVLARSEAEMKGRGEELFGGNLRDYKSGERERDLM